MGLIKRTTATLVAAFVATVLLCSSAQTARADELAGSGEWQSLSSDAIRGKWSVSLTRRGNIVEGSLTLDGSNVFAGSAVSGTVDASSIVLGVMLEGAKEARFSGKLDGTKISGEWESAVVGDYGVWFGSLTKK